MLRLTIVVILILSVIAVSYISYRLISKPNVGVTQESSDTAKSGSVVDSDYVKVILKEGVVVAEFARRYNIDISKIEGPSSAGVYRVPVIKEKGVFSTVKLFEKDPDVVSANLLLYYTLQ